jgi:hypothetical protein
MDRPTSDARGFELALIIAINDPGPLGVSQRFLDARRRHTFHSLLIDFRQFVVGTLSKLVVALIHRSLGLLRTARIILGRGRP